MTEEQYHAASTNRKAVEVIAQTIKYFTEKGPNLGSLSHHLAHYHPDLYNTCTDIVLKYCLQQLDSRINKLEEDFKNL